MAATANDLTSSSRPCAISAPCRPTPTSTAVIRDLGLDRPPIDPTTLTADEMVAELRRGHQGPSRLRRPDAQGADALRQGHPVPRRRHGHHGPRRRHPGRDRGRRHLLPRAARRTDRPRHRCRLADTPIDLDGYRAALGFADDPSPPPTATSRSAGHLIRRRIEQRSPKTSAPPPPSSPSGPSGAWYDGRLTLPYFGEPPRRGSDLGFLRAPQAQPRETRSRPPRRDPAPSSRRRTRAEPTTTPSAT